MFKPRTFEMVKKEFVVLLRRKKFVALMILLPLILGGLMAILPSLTSFNDVKIGLCDLDHSIISSQFVSEVKSSFTTTSFNESRSFCVSELSRGVKAGAYTIGIIVDEGFGNNLQNLKKASVDVYYDNSDFRFETYLDWFIYKALDSFKAEIISQGESQVKSQIGDVSTLALGVQAVASSSKQVVLGSPIESVVNQLSDKADSFVNALNLLKNLDIGFLSEPVSVNKNGVYSINSATTTAFPIVVGILSIFTLFMLASTSVIFDKSSNYITRIKTSKTLLLSYIFAKCAVFTFIMSAQFVLLILLFLVFGAGFNINLLTLALTLIALSFVNTLIGILIGLFSENETVAVLISLLLTLPFLFVSGVFYPSEMFPSFIRFFADAFPLKTEISLVKYSSVFGSSFSLVSSSLITLGIYLLILGVACWALLKFRSE